MERTVQPELLDSLPHDHPDARRGRRDLVLVNLLMGNPRWIVKTIRKMPEWHNVSMIELGAGEGHLCRSLHRAFPDTPIEAIDLAPRPANLPAAIRWHQGDLFAPPDSFPEITRQHLLIANLFLHHFEAPDLARLGAMAKNSAGLIAVEPERRALHIWQGRLISPLIGRATRHDLPVSVRAGFQGTEIAASLGLPPEKWHIRSSRTFFGAHRFHACPRNFTHDAPPHA